MLLLILASLEACSTTQTVRVGVVDVSKVLRDTKWGRQQKERLITMQASMEMRLHDECGDLEKLASQARNDADVRTRYEKKYVYCMKLHRDLESHLQAIQNKEYGKIRRHVEMAARIVAKKLNLFLVLDSSQLVYSSYKIDITQDVAQAIEENSAMDSTPLKNE